MTTKTVVISGITSSLGLHLAPMLAAKGYRVRGFARHLERAQILQAELVEADLLDRKKMEEICSDADFVIHLAALSSPWGKWSDFHRVNVLGTEQLLKGAEKGKVKRFIHVSTPSLYFDFSDRFNILESDPFPEKSVNGYAESKKRAETLVDQSSLDCITIRPRAVFGPYDQALFPRILKACEKKGIPAFSKNSPLVDVTYVENVAHALSLALEAPAMCVREKYNITNGEPVLLWDLLSQLLEALSLPARLRKTPYPLAYVGAWMAEQIGKLRGKEPSLTRYGLGVMRYSQTFSIEKAKTDLSYTPIVTLKEGIQRCVRWFQTA